MAFGSIYKIEFPNGKVYIGLTTTSLEQRKKEHKSCAKCGDPRPLYNALRKHNMVNTFELIEIDTADNKEELCEKEMGYILMYRSFEREYGYNRTIGGEGTNGYVFTKEDRQKMSKSQKKRIENPGEIERRVEAATKFWNNNEAAKQKHSMMKKEQYSNLEWRKLQSEKIKKSYEENPELAILHRKRMKEMHEKRPEIAIQHSYRMKKRFEDPEVRQKNIEAQKKHYEDNPEARQKRSEQMKEYYKNNPHAALIYGEKMKEYYKEHPEALEQMSKTAKELWKTPEYKKNVLNARGLNKPFDMFKKDGTFVRTFTYQFEAKEYLKNELNITSTILISEVLRGVRKSTAGFVFKYK